MLLCETVFSFVIPAALSVSFVVVKLNEAGSIVSFYATLIFP
jgi:hypothetical protein